MPVSLQERRRSTAGEWRKEPYAMDGIFVPACHALYEFVEQTRLVFPPTFDLQHA